MVDQVVAVVGRPNVGKSTLFNKLIGERRAIVDDTPGVTRDRLLGECVWQNYRFQLIDTGGIEADSNEELPVHIREQSRAAIDLANVIIFVVDVRAGVTAADREVAAILQKSGRPVVVAVNKCDSIGDNPLAFYDFYELGLGELVAVSSIHGHGTGDLLDEVCKYLEPEDPDAPPENDIKVAVIGRPNAGKSSLINKILGENRLIVSEVAGTTRDAIDTKIENRFGSYTFIDTAGMRRKGRISDAVEKYSVMRALSAVDRAQVCVIMLDATEGFSEQDSKVAGYAHEQGKGCIIAINKWDLIEKDGKTMDVQRKTYEQHFSFMSYAPIIFISAMTGQRIDRLFELINYVDNQNAMRITTGRLNDLLAHATARVQPPSDKGKRLKIYYITQPSTRPPTFVCFVNRADLFHFSYQRYLENQIRETFGMEGTPIRLLVREREEG